MKNIAIFASGSGSNAENIASYFAERKDIKVSAIITNKRDAGVVQRAEKSNIPCYFFSNQQIADTSELLALLKSLHIDAIILAGFLRLIPLALIEEFPDKIVNIHPALLPKYGGAGMYGAKVHETVLINREKETGITIHLVNKNYDEGEILFQASVALSDAETVESIADKVHQLEYQHFPEVIDKWLTALVTR